jgi:hypothetical protein
VDDCRRTPAPVDSHKRAEIDETIDVYLASPCYDLSMTTVEILFAYSTPPTEQTVLALAGTKDVYGIRRLSFDREARTLRVEYDATRLTAAAVLNLVRQAGLEVQGELSLLPPQPEPEAAPAA